MRHASLGSPSELRPPIPRLTLVGTAWVTRGVRYWALRAWWSFASFLLLVITGGLTGAILVDVLHDDPGPWRTIELVGVLLGVVIGCVMAGRAALRQCRVRQVGPWPPMHPSSREEVRADRANGARKARRDRWLIAPARFAGVFLTVFVLPICVGWTFLFFVCSFRRYVGNDERFAVVRLDNWRTLHPEWTP